MSLETTPRHRQRPLEHGDNFLLVFWAAGLHVPNEFRQLAGTLLPVVVVIHTVYGEVFGHFTFTAVD